MSSLMSVISDFSAHIWYALPLSIVISLVYGATRHEEIPDILVHSWKAAVWIVLFMAGIAATVWIGGWGVA